ncbi:hypothetical protein BKA70DRAFT_876340 [Coprinopsis sp. MPI-PUGE-AT-0042]|nr:hypothetical protein BKA70DRAFT_876340 [Coprinopsis sp. MPI-PUGE-AT-0042]
MGPRELCKPSRCLSFDVLTFFRHTERIQLRTLPERGRAFWVVLWPLPLPQNMIPQPNHRTRLHRSGGEHTSLLLLLPIGIFSVYPVESPTTSNSFQRVIVLDHHHCSIRCAFLSLMPIIRFAIIIFALQLYRYVVYAICAGAEQWLTRSMETVLPRSFEPAAEDVCPPFGRLQHGKCQTLKECWRKDPRERGSWSVVVRNGIEEAQTPDLLEYNR